MYIVDYANKYISLRNGIFDVCIVKNSLQKNY